MTKATHTCVEERQGGVPNMPACHDRLRAQLAEAEGRAEARLIVIGGLEQRLVQTEARCAALEEGLAKIRDHKDWPQEDWQMVAYWMEDVARALCPDQEAGS